MTPYGLRHCLDAFSNRATMIPYHVSVRSHRDLGAGEWGVATFSVLFLSPWVEGEKLTEMKSQEGILEAGLGDPCPCPARDSTHVTLTSLISSCCGSKMISGSKIKTPEIKSKDNPDAGFCRVFRGSQSVTYLKPCPCILNPSSNTSR